MRLPELLMMCNYYKKLIELKWLIGLYIVSGLLPLVSYGHESTQVVVEVSANGYEPAEISIEPHTQVVFKNVGDQAYWPASDSHPSHTGFDGTTLAEHCFSPSNATSLSFDACKKISPGETWSFIFEEPGEYSYHDHLWPHLKGFVVVEPLNEDSGLWQKIWTWFKNLWASLFGEKDATKTETVLQDGDTRTVLFKQIAERYVGLVQEEDARYAIDALKEESNSDEKVMAICHDVLHEIGSYSFEQYGSFDSAIKYQSDFCNSGYIHGIFEAYFSSTETPILDISAQCTSYGMQNGRPFDVWQCRHGAGHGYMYFTGGDLETSLDYCSSAFSEIAALDCQNGVYMEVFNMEVLANEPADIADDPFEVCRNQSEAKSACYSYVPTYLSLTESMDFIDMFQECKKAEIGFKQSCVSGVGAEAMKRNLHNTGLVFDLCTNVGVNSFERSCVRGAVGMYLNQTASYEAGVQLCSNLSGNHKSICDEYVKDIEPLFADISSLIENETEDDD